MINGYDFVNQNKDWNFLPNHQLKRIKANHSRIPSLQISEKSHLYNPCSDEICFSNKSSGSESSQSFRSSETSKSKWENINSFWKESKETIFITHNKFSLSKPQNWRDSYGLKSRSSISSNLTMNTERTFKTIIVPSKKPEISLNSLSSLWNDKEIKESI